MDRNLKGGFCPPFFYIYYKMKLLFFLPFFLFTIIPSNAQLLTEPDKQEHFIAGAFFGSFAYAIVLDKTENNRKAFLASVVTAVAFGTIKETIDSREKGNYFDTRDLLATTYGGLSIGITLDLISKKGKNKGKLIRFKF